MKDAALDAIRKGRLGGRLRAILMTAAAMIFGMIPTAIGFGEGGAQLSRPARTVPVTAVPPSATFATGPTLLSTQLLILQRGASVASASLNPMIPRARSGRDLVNCFYW